MRWPYVHRSKLDKYRRLYNANCAIVRESEARALAAEARADELRAQLNRSEIERTDINLKLIRVGFGIHPFQEQFTQTSVLPQEPTADPVANPLRAGASPEEVRATFVREAMELYGHDLRKISRYVESKQTEYYAHRERPSILSHEELASAAKVAADLEAAIEEGAREAAKG